MNTEQTQSNREYTLQILQKIADHNDGNSQGVPDGLVGYRDHKAIIDELFSWSNQAYSIQSIVLRLTVIDSFYSTNAAYSYFSIDEMAEKILSLGQESDAAGYFASIANGDTNADNKGLFSEPYGIRKNLGEGSKQVSLLSKYAYFVLRQYPNQYPKGFPIYDSLAEKIHPLLANYLGVSLDKRTDKDDIHRYIANLDKIRRVLFDEVSLFKDVQQYDILDALLWTMGKIGGGNLSLLLDRKDYTQFICNLDLAEERSQKCNDDPTPIFNNTGEAYGKRLFEKYGDMLVKESRQSGGVHYAYNINNIISHELEKDDGAKYFNDLSCASYMSEMRDYWLKINKKPSQSVLSPSNPEDNSKTVVADKKHPCSIEKNGKQGCIENILQSIKN